VFETDDEEWARDHVAWVTILRLLGAADGLPLRQRMADGEFGPEAASANPPAGVGREECPLHCGFRVDYSRCVCTGTAPDLCWRMALNDPPHPAVIAEEEKRLAWVAAREAAEAARGGQPRPSLASGSAGAGASLPEAPGMGTVPTDTETAVSVRVEPAEPYSEPADNRAPPQRTNLTHPQTLRLSPSRRG